jgi:epoxyqueuosine reductase
MSSFSTELGTYITTTIRHQAVEAGTVTSYRVPLVGFAAASDPRFQALRRVAEPTHMLPQELLPGARSVVSFFLPFAPWVVEANIRHSERVAEEWARAYVETNALIGRITAHLIEALAGRGVRAAAEPATHNFDPVSLISRWSHKSMAVITELGSFGLHHMVITDSGCAGRFGSLVLDAELPIIAVEPKERCLYFHDGSCLECIFHCPVQALGESEPLDKRRCYRRLRNVAQGFEHLGLVDVCGKCAIGPCSFESAVQQTKDNAEN